MHIYLLTLLFAAFMISCRGFETSSLNSYVCQAHRLQPARCNVGLIKIKTVTVITTSNISALEEASTGLECARLKECTRTIHSEKDVGLSPDYSYLYRWIVSQCNGNQQCNQTNHTLPEWWNLIDLDSNCESPGIQYFAAVLLDIVCLANEEVPTVAPPPPTTPRTKPSTAAPTTPFAALVGIYQSSLNEREKILLGVAIGMALVILLMLLTVLFCWESYTTEQRRQRVLRDMGGPKEQTLDEYDYSGDGAWRARTNNAEAVGEYSGIKPDEFVTVDESEYRLETPSTYSTLDVDNFTGRYPTDRYVSTATDGEERPYITFHNYGDSRHSLGHFSTFRHDSEESAGSSTATISD